VEKLQNFDEVFKAYLKINGEELGARLAKKAEDLKRQKGAAMHVPALRKKPKATKHQVQNECVARGCRVASMATEDLLEEVYTFLEVK
jgi:hypothetical protein